MARTKEYNRQEVLEKATMLFWEKGYKGTSMSDIVKTTGLNTASLYKEFGDKDGLFEAAQEFYTENLVIVFTQLLVDEPNFEGIKKFIKGIVDWASSEGFLGCLMMNALTEKSSLSANSNSLLLKFCDGLEELLKTAIGNAQDDGDISKQKDADVLASFISCSVHGLVLYGKYPSKKKEIPKLFDVLILPLTA